MTEILDAHVLNLSVEMANIFHQHYPDCRALVVQDVPGEDEIYAIDEHNKPAFSMLVSASRKLVFIKYYVLPCSGLRMLEEIKANLRQYRFLLKLGNPMLESTDYEVVKRRLRRSHSPLGELSNEFLATYRMHDWYKISGVLETILRKTREMTLERLLRTHPDKIDNIRGYCLYAGSAVSISYPELSFGIRDVDVQVFLSPEWWTNMRGAFTRDLGIPEMPPYGDQPRWLDLMWNSFHTEQGSFGDNVCRYIEEMRYKSDRWATIARQPMIDLVSKQIVYTPKWLEKVHKVLADRQQDN